MSRLDSLFPRSPRTQDASELERALWIRSLLGDQDSLEPSETLALRIHERFFERGQTLYRFGDAADRLYFIVRGEVTLSHAGVKSRDFGPRGVLGMMDALQMRPHAFDAVALADTLVLELDIDDWFEFLEDHFDFLRSIIRRLIDALPPTSPPRPDLSKPTARLRARRDGDRDLRAALGPTIGLSFVERLAVLRACPALSRAGIQALARLAVVAEPWYLDEGETRTLTSSALYVVEYGRVGSVTSEPSGKTWYEEMSAGGAVAGLGLLEADRYDCEVTAKEPTSLFRIASERIFDVVEDHFSLGQSLLAHAAAEAEAVTLQLQVASSATSSRAGDELLASESAIRLPGEPTAG
ncbi:MAG TPA: cyclic nucleotide-binding domain-containing protein [Polyangiaceae bacterium]|nr:cyclic nucleotide-binding domain-containing protein [Polyangiaceae bacterium]